MKKHYFILPLLLMTVTTVFAQFNIRETYSFGREHPVTAFELVSTDRWGSTYMISNLFHPLNTDSHTSTGFYTEIERELNFWHGTAFDAWSLHLEWNGGQFATNTLLVGTQYLIHNTDFSNMVALGLYYRQPVGGHNASVPVQFSIIAVFHNIFGVTGLHFKDITDFYGNHTVWTVDGKEKETHASLFNLFELWYNVGRHFDCPNLNIIGSLELGVNNEGAYHTGIDFMKNEGLTATTSLGIRWDF
ncbi:MAG: DUF5020 family protein [Bacteroidales bacterium]|nr:DUF5020 family protein [Candidatus Colimorpha onthohippi]